MKTGRERRKGFLMLELMIALVLLTVALMGIAPLLTSSIVSDSASRTASVAAVSAEAMVEQLRSAGYAGAANGSDSVTIDSNVYRRSWVVTTVTANALLKVAVTVTWGSGNNHLVISGYIARPS